MYTLTTVIENKVTLSETFFADGNFDQNSQRVLVFDVYLDFEKTTDQGKRKRIIKPIYAWLSPSIANIPYSVDENECLRRLINSDEYDRLLDEVVDFACKNSKIGQENILAKRVKFSKFIPFSRVSEFPKED